MPNFDIDLSVQDIYYEMTTYEKKEMYRLLKDDFDNENPLVEFANGFSLPVHKNPTFMDAELFAALLKIFSSRDRLTSEEEDYFINFSKKF
jgi:hypothetical protein